MVIYGKVTVLRFESLRICPMSALVAIFQYGRHTHRSIHMELNEFLLPNNTNSFIFYQKYYGEFSINWSLRWYLFSSINKNQASSVVRGFQWGCSLMTLVSFYGNTMSLRPQNVIFNFPLQYFVVHLSHNLKNHVWGRVSIRLASDDFKGIVG